MVSLRRFTLDGQTATIEPPNARFRRGSEWFTVRAIWDANRTCARARVHRMLAALEREGKLERDHKIAVTLWRLKP